VVLEGGLGASSIGWSRVADELGVVARVLRYDRAGLGTAPPVAGGRGLGRLADELVDVVVAADAGPAVLVGHSWGASVVRLAAHRRPDLVAGLVLLEPVPDRWLLRFGRLLRPGGTLVYLALETAARTGLLALLARTARVRSWFVGRRGALPERIRTELLAEVCRAAHHRAGALEFAGMATGSRAELAELDRAGVAPWPVLVVSGGRPGGRRSWWRRRLTSAHAALARTYGGEHVLLDGAGHLLPREHPVGVADLVTRLCPR
jgi:pimeloyl-ACP methyl ester carboxylesterase